jgi:hypothetical protein
MDMNVIFGFRYNLPAALSSGGTKITELTISGPYINISRRVVERLFGNKNLNLDLGGGANYSFYSGNLISITGSFGYQIYTELSMKTEAQILIGRFGYIRANGRGSNQYDFSNTGYYATAGLEYKL